MKYLDIALNIPLNQPFTYSTVGLSDETKIEKGMRAEIRFGNRKTSGFITEIYDFAGKMRILQRKNTPRPADFGRRAAFAAGTDENRRLDFAILSVLARRSLICNGSVRQARNGGNRFSV